MKINKLNLIALSLAAIVSCKEGEKKNDSLNAETEGVAVSTESSITLEELEGSPAYENASLSLSKPANTTKAEEGTVDFAFEVKNYELGVQTDSELTEKMANSQKGQHIHYILDNKPYSAHYEPNFTKEIPSGTHYMIAFLSRSYHESVKNDNSFVAKKWVVGKETDTMDVNLDEPTLIYSRPKGEYSGADTDNLLLDFFLLNTTLSEDGNKVRATINDTEFLITEWAPQVIKGLPKGEVTIKLELLDENDQLIPGAFNEVTRTVTLKE